MILWHLFGEIEPWNDPEVNDRARSSSDRRPIIQKIVSLAVDV